MTAGRSEKMTGNEIYKQKEEKNQKLPEMIGGGRPLEPFTPKRKETTMMETAREIIRERMSHAIKYDVKRLSPRGPNPKHH
ncbi:hypothetical protein H5410_049649 [Solanum commersonii]|uniref:Uncharacterized protein n=1 Tax=Solanum commersonii TaxID=4109 RepID=A0A9J5WVP6_SOLCO|nr:hypothetical protein H5410_049649 [Solanum commersonii]